MTFTTALAYKKRGQAAGLGVDAPDNLGNGFGRVFGIARIFAFGTECQKEIFARLQAAGK